MLRALSGPLAVFVVGLLVFGAFSYKRLLTHSNDNHYVYMADGMLHGRLALEGRPPHLNDWAKYDGKWYVSFPPAPAILMMPAVAIWGLDFNDRIFTLFFAAAGPALLFWLLQLMVARGRFERSTREIALLALVFGTGTVYFFSAVQGSVWFTAHMVGGVLLLAYAIASLDGRHPILAGLFLGLAFATRPPMLVAFPFFLHEMLRPHAPADAPTAWAWLRDALKAMGWKRLVLRCLAFGAPLAVILGLLMALNAARFDDPFEFGHKYLQVRWVARIEEWGLFNYHYLGRNLTVALALVPWISHSPPYFGVSRHGLALWFTTPVLLWILWPKARTPLYTALAVTAAAVAIPDLLYQNSGWLQFGYRFSLDYAPFLMLMLAASGRRFGRLFVALAIVGIAINAFGAVTFDRYWDFYPTESTRTYFQPE
jgi:hypothetical protein